MKPVKLFYLRNCPFCRKAMRYIDEAKQNCPELRDIEIEMIEESEHPEIADSYDYYYVRRSISTESRCTKGAFCRARWRIFCARPFRAGRNGMQKQQSI